MAIIKITQFHFLLKILSSNRIPTFKLMDIFLDSTTRELSTKKTSLMALAELFLKITSLMDNGKMEIFMDTVEALTKVVIAIK